MRGGKETTRSEVKAGVLEERDQISRLENENYELKLKIRLLERKMGGGGGGTGTIGSTDAAAKRDSASAQQLQQLEAKMAQTLRENADLKQKLSSWTPRIKDHYQKQVNEYYEQVRAELQLKEDLRRRLETLEQERISAPLFPSTQAANVANAASQTSAPDAIDSLHLELADAKKKLATAENQTQQLKAALEETTARLETATAEASVAAAACTAASSGGKGSDTEIARLQNKVDQLEKELKTSKLQQTSKRAWSSQYEREDLEAKYRSEVRKLELKLSECQREASKRVDYHELASAQAKISEKATEIARLQGVVTGLENELRGMTINTELHERRIDDLCNRLELKEGTDLRILEEKTRLKRELDLSRADYSELQQVVETLNVQIERDQRALNATAQEKTALQQALSRQTEPSALLEDTRRQLAETQERLLGAERTNLLRKRSAVTGHIDDAAKENGKAPMYDIAALADKLGINSRVYESVS